MKKGRVTNIYIYIYNIIYEMLLEIVVWWTWDLQGSFIDEKKYIRYSLWPNESLQVELRQKVQDTN